MVPLTGLGRMRTDTNLRLCGRAWRFWRGLFERFNVLKRFVVAEIGEIEDIVAERFALTTRAWPHLCPKAKWSLF